MRLSNTKMFILMYNSKMNLLKTRDIFKDVSE